MLEDKVFSQVSSEFVSPLFPSCGQSVVTSIVFSPDLEIGETYCVTNHNGVQWRYPSCRRTGNRFFFTVEGAYRPEVLRYYFVFSIHGRFYYYSKSKVTVFPPQAKNHFTIVPDFESPRWIASSFCYQIFPDRFDNGDRTNDVKSGEYVYDGFPVTAHEFDQKPEGYDKAHCLDFFNGDLKGIENRLDYLASLGVSCLYINPICSSRTVHRFDAIDYFHVDEKLGGDEALVSLIEKCHARGIRVVVDISINHTSPENEWFRKALEDRTSPEAGFYYLNDDGSYSSWAGVSTMPQLNFNSQLLRDRLYRKEDSAMQKFLRPPFNQDGWRLDVAPELGRHGSDQLCKEVWREVHSCLKAVNRDVYLVGEDWGDASEYLEGDMWDATMNYYGSGRPLRSWLGERDRFLTGGWGHSPQADNEYNAYDLAEALESAADSSSDLSRYFRMNLYDSHDTPRLHNNGAVFRQKRYEGVVMALCLLPGMPNIYYGDEILLDGEMGSVEASRYPMCWDESRWNMDVLNVHTLLGQLRKDESLAFASSYYIPLDEDALLILRKSADRAWALVLNKGKRRKLSFSSFLLDGFSVSQCLYGEAQKDLSSFEVNDDESLLVILSK